ncbi:MAG TPA: non-ribosomal peptide synthase/polyketide synthase, partial [Pseudonocardiaceae bacterium]|nr:non-ribosomal peptide synthase/polyketide synthase [Pseudonocardiaceae bacterium]
MNDTDGRTVSAPGPLSQLFERQVHRTPDAPAVTAGSDMVSYRELNTRANRLAHLLIAAGAGPERIVALALPRSVDIVVAQLAAAKAGAAYLPVDPAYPVDRITFMLTDARPVLVVSDTIHAPAPGGARQLLLDAPATVAELAEQPGHDPSDADRTSPLRLANPAYVIYTSGSTGRPKGVVVSHRGLAGFAAAEAERFDVRAGDRVLQFASPSFDASVLELCMSLLVGATLVVPPPGPLLGDGLAGVLAGQRITHALIPPAALATLPPAELPEFRTLVVGGDACPADLVERWAPSRRMINAYGPTESTVVSTWSEPLAPGRTPPIGRSIPTVTAHVLDDRLRPVPAGAVGELHVAGVALARGYLNRPGRTAELFVANPFGAPGSRLYRTGDRVRQAENGEFEFVARVDHQVKIRGVRVEPGEIETVLRGSADVADVVVIARGEPRRLVAYVVPALTATPAARVLRALVADALPPALVPAAFVVLDALPLDPNGKLDRRALPAPGVTTDIPAGHVAPRTEVERTLAGIWADVLGVESVGVEDDFVELGGDSILASQVFARMRATFAVDGSLRTLFDVRTIAGLAELVSVRQEDAPIIPVAVGELPLSSAQQRLWFLDGLTPGGTEYNTGVGLRLSGPLDEPALRTALAALAERHASLRTTFHTVDGVGRQWIAETGTISLSTVDLTGRAVELDRTLAEQLERPFELATGPLTRAVLVRLEPDQHVLLLHQHHIVTDGWSVRILVDELAECYTAARHDRPARLPELTVQYPDFAVWERERRTDPALAEHLDYWRRTLAGLEVLDLPTDHPRPPVRDPAGAIHRVDLPAQLVRGLTELGQAHGATLFMTLVAAVQLVLSRYSGQRDVPVGTAIAGRDRPELEELVGFFVNTVVLRSTVDDQLTFAEFLAAVRETVLAAFAHGDVPFDRLVEELAPDRDPGRTPLVQALVVLQQAMVRPRDLDELRVDEYDLPRPAARFDLVMEFLPRADTLNLAVEYNTALFTAETVERLAEHLLILLDRIVARPNARLGRLSLLTSAERQQLLVSWNGAERLSPPATLPAVFRDQVDRTPDTIAVTCGDQQLSYHELNSRANRLARLLISRGAAAERFVALALPRSADMIVALLAVAQSGAAYLPVDPAYPADRIAFMLDDAAPALLLSTAEVAAGLPTDDRVPTLILDAPETTAALAALAEVEVTDADRVRPLRPGHPAYVIYTSGSTGRPKGVVVAQESVVDLVSWARAEFGAGGLGRVVASTSLNFDVSVFEIFCPLLTGGGIEVVHDVLALAEPPAGADSWTASLVSAVPSAFAQVIGEGTAPVDAETVVLAGEALTARAMRDIRAAMPGSRIANIYGPTEATVYATAWYSDGQDLDQSPPIGHPVANTLAYVLDAGLRPVPIGVPGELYLGGRALARGYLNRPGLTAERFGPNPFGPAGSRLYRTGDLVRWNGEGELVYLGRADHQVKVRGFRIEPGEIEATLVGHPDVAEAVVLARQDNSPHKRLVAYLVPTAGAAVDQDALRTWLAGSLPDYMVPAAFVELERLPLNPNGKLDRNALPAPDRSTTASDYLPPRTERERTLAAILAEVLGLDRVGLHDNFFGLGGDSILSIQVVSRARTAGLRLTAKDIFLHQTVATLAAVVSEVTERAAEQGAVRGELPLTPIQHWLFETNPQRPQHFHQSMTIEPAPDVDETALRVAMSALLDQHDALRMRFERTADGGWRQHNASVEPADVLRQHDLSGHAATDQAALISEITGAAQAGLDLATGPLWLAILFRLGADRPPLLWLSVHHLVVDGVSWRILLEDLHTAYQQVRAGEPVRLGAKTTSFKDWATGLAAHTAAGGFDDELPFWTGLPENTSLPADADGPNTVESTRSVTVRLDARRTRALLQDVPAAYRTQINDVLLAALGRTVCGWTGRDRVLIDLEGHGREDVLDGVDTSRTVGWFTTLFPVGLAVPAGRDWAPRLKSVKEELRRIPRRGIGYGALRGLAGTAPAIDPQLSFNYLGQFGLSEQHTGLYRALRGELALDADPAAERAHVLDVVGRIDDGCLEFTWFYSANRHQDSTVGALAEDMLTALTEIVEHCTRPGTGGRTPSDFPLARLDQPTVDRLVGDGRAVEEVYPLTPTQAGMVFHRLSQPGQGVYFQQVTLVLDGVPEVAALARAWQQVIDRTPALRSEIVWDGVPEPLQLVRRQVRPPIDERDWTGLSASEQSQALQQFLTEDRVSGINQRHAPLLRLMLARLSANTVQLVWTFDHVLLDGWSLFGVLADVLAAHGGAVELPARRPFRDYLDWLTRQDLPAAEQYWQGRLAGLAEPTPLPYDRAPRAAHSAESTDSIRVALTAAESDRLRAMAQGAGLTLNTIVQGAWAVLLSRHSGQSEVVFGSTVSGRPADLAGVESIIGIFITTLPTRVAVPGGTSVLDWLHGVQADATDARRFDFLPSGQLRACADLPERTNLFDSIVVFENYPVDRDPADGVRVRELHGIETTNYPLSVIAYPETELAFRLGYDPALFDAGTVDRLAGHLLVLLRALAADVHRPVRALPMLGETETRQLLTDWTATPGQPRVDTIASRFAAQVRRTPDAPAVTSHDDHTLSYAELNVRANQLAHRLLTLGLRPEQPVALLLDHSVDLVVAELAIAKAGGAYVPLDVHAPVARLRLLLTETGARLLLTDPAWYSTGSQIHNGQILLPGWDQTLTDEPAGDPAVPVRPDALAYLMHTSGSTGTPKGIAVTQHNVVTLTDHRRFHTPAHHRVLLHSPTAFDAATYELWVPLLTGGTVVTAPPVQLDVPTLHQLVTEQRITALWLTAGLFRVIAQDNPTVLATLAEVWTGGDVVPASAVRAVVHACPGLAVVDGYGPTETTTFATSYPISEPIPDTIPIGRPLDGMRAYILDSALNPCPIGTPGQLYLAGNGLARGYHNQPGRTAEKFVANPYGPPGDRLYDTGDLAHWTAEGTVYFHGRTDNQAKIRGFRIELGEIEAALTAHEQISQAVVVATADDLGRKRLVAHVVPTSADVLDPAALRAWTGTALPDYMVPAAFVLLDELPLSRNGKVDHRALPAPVWEASAGRVEPRTETERVLARIWTDVLGIDQVGVHDNFFELGGDSILSIQIASRAHGHGLRLTPQSLFRAPTIATLATTLTPTTTARAAQRPVTGPAPLTPVQHWFFATPMARPEYFHQSIVAELGDRTDPVALGRAFQAVLTQHDALRLRFAQVEGEWRQQHGPVEEIEAPQRLDLATVAEEALPAVLAGIIEEIESGLVLSSGPLVRAVLVELGAGRRPRLLVIAHHLVIDGVSWRILLDDLNTAYQQAVAGRPIQLGAKTTSFQDWASGLTELATTGGFDDELDHWTALDAPAELPVDGYGDNTVANMRTVNVQLDPKHTAALLTDVPAAYRTQINDVLLTALASSLCGWAGRDQVLVNLEGHGREDVLDGVDTSRTIGWFTTIYPVGLTRPDDDWGTALKSTKERLRGIPRRGIGYGALRHLAGKAELVDRPAARISFNYLGRFRWSAEGDQLVRAIPAGLDGASAGDNGRAHELDVVGSVEGDRLGFTWYYSTALHEPATVRRLAQDMLRALVRIIEHCARADAGGRTPSDFPLTRLSQAEVDGLVGDGRAVEDVYPLTPMQAGMVFHGMVHSDSSAYLNQVQLRLSGVSDPTALAEAWQRVVDRTPILRSSVVWAGVPEPVQVVWRHTTVPVTFQHWTEDEYPAKVVELLARDRAEGLRLESVPLLRLVIATLPDNDVVVVWTFHHVLLDGWSAAAVFGEVCALYAAINGGTEPALVARRPFRDYLGWLAEQDAEQAERHWRSVLAGITGPTALPYDRPPVAAHRAQSGGTVRGALSADRSGQLRDLAARSGLTLSTIVQGAWAVLLSRHSGDNEVVFGSTVSGRPADLPGVEAMVGLFINTVPSRLRVEGGRDVLGWLRAAQEEQLAARVYDFTSLAQIQGWAELPPGTNLFDSIVVFENYPFDPTAITAHGVLLREVTDVEPTNYPISVVVTPGVELGFRLDYDPDLFDRTTVERLAIHLDALLTGIAADPNRPVRALPMLGERETWQLLTGWNSTVEQPRTDTVVSRFAAQVRQAPEATAVVTHDGRELSYADLNGYANQLAHQLIELGVRAEQPVGLLLRHGVELVAAELAVLKAGGAYVPLDSRAPEQRLRTMLDEAGISVLLTDQADHPVAGSGYRGTVVVLGSRGTLAHQPDTDPLVALRPDSLAYLMHTSGSTGTPKAIAVTHHNISTLTDHQQFHNGHHHTVLLHSPTAFDAATYELWVPLLTGGTVVTAPPTQLDPVMLDELIRRHGITALWLTAGLFRLIAHENPAVLAPLDEVWTGGDVVPATAVQAVLAACPDLTVVDGYGPTEATTFATSFPIGRPVPDPIPIGRPLDGMRLYLLDSTLTPCPIGTPGRLYLAGSGLARGYHNHPRLTAEKFIANPYGPPGDRLYDTGDIARWSADGTVHYLGRTDNQTKLRGFRIELGEIETALTARSDITQAVVLTVETDGRKRLVAYVVATGLDTEAVRAGLAADLPDYMIPAAFVSLDALPLTRNGKLDRAALLALGLPAADRVGHVPPRTEIERVLAGIWADVLRVDRIGVHDNFFELGGDSILSIQIASRARGHQLTISPQHLFSTPTIAALASTLGTTTKAAPAESGPVTGRAPLTPVQHWLFETNPGQPEWFDQSVTVELVAGVDRDALRAALGAVLDQHDALRMRFPRVDDQWQQENPGPDAVSVDDMFEVRASSEKDGVSAAVHQGFDLATGPLVRAVLFEPDNVLLIAVHHLVIDGVSWRILLDDLATAYRQAAAGRPVQLGARTTSFTDWATGLSELATTGGFDDELAHWTGLAASTEPVLPTDDSGPNTVVSTQTVTVRLNEADTDALLHDVPGIYRTQINDVLLAALGEVLGRWAGRDRVVVDLEGHGREDVLDGREDVLDGRDTARTVGWFTSIFPVLLGRDPDWGSALKSTKERLRAVPRRGVGYGALRYLARNVALRDGPDPQVSFNYLGQFDENLSDTRLYTAGGDLDSAVGPESGRPHLLDIVGAVRRGSLEFSWFYSTNQHHEDTVDALAEQLLDALREIIRHCADPAAGGRTPADFPLAALDQATVDRLVGDGRSIEDVYPLTPMQAGIVFHGLAQHEHGVYLEQVTFVLAGVTDPAALATAWQRVVDRTPVLRSSMCWTGPAEPVQLVHRQVTLPVRHLDWRQSTESERAAALAALLAEDRAAGINLAAPPLLRLTLARVADDEVQLVWTFHHVLLDGWSV